MEQYPEGERFVVVRVVMVVCQVGNSWDWRVEHENGTGSAKSEINFVADRHHHHRSLACQVNSRAIKVMVSK